MHVNPDWLPDKPEDKDEHTERILELITLKPNPQPVGPLTNSILGFGV